MRVKPVRRKSMPQYPTHDYLREHPELLYVVPGRWRKNVFVLKVLGGAACLILASQSQAAQGQPGTTAPSRIAPLFVHGEGRGSFGCMTINPPVFLSEDEARQVIQDEAKKAGLEFAPDAFTIRDATVPLTDLNYCSSLPGPGDPRAIRPATQTRDLLVDGFDRNHNVAYEFVSREDLFAWERKPPLCDSSAGGFDTKGTAEKLRTGLKATVEQPWVGVFYEPFARVAERSPQKAVRQLDEEELRKQVRDFVQWLQAQGVI